MKILKCYIENFGTLHNIKCSLHDGLNSLNEENGWGKSTFAAFIKAIFYGLDRKTGSTAFNSKDARKNMEPWQGGKYGGYLEFVVNGHEYRATRFFGNKPKEDFFELLDLGTGKPSYDYSERLGEDIFGIDSEGFERSSYIPQNRLETASDDSVNARLMNVLEGDRGMMNFEEAVGILEASRRELKKTGKRGKIDQDLERISELEVSIRELEDKDKVRANLKEKLHEVVEEKKNSRIAEEEATEALDTFMKNNVSKRKMVGFLIFGLLLLVIDGVGIGIEIFQSGISSIQNLSTFMKASLVVLVIGAILIIIGIIMQIRGRRADRAAEEELERLQTEVKERRYAYEAAYEKETELNREIDKLTQEVDDILLLSDELIDLQEENERDMERFKLINAAISFLGQAKENLSVHYLDKMRENFKNYTKELLPDKAEITLDSDFNITVEEKGQKRPIDSMSSGTRDLIYLCARFSLVDALYDEERPCLILDDVLNNLDDSHFREAIKLIENLAEVYQVIYLTCNLSRSPKGQSEIE